MTPAPALLLAAAALVSAADEPAIRAVYERLRAAAGVSTPLRVDPAFPEWAMYEREPPFAVVVGAYFLTPRGGKVEALVFVLGHELAHAVQHGETSDLELIARHGRHRLEAHADLAALDLAVAAGYPLSTAMAGLEEFAFESRPRCRFFQNFSEEHPSSRRRWLNAKLYEALLPALAERPRLTPADFRPNGALRLAALMPAGRRPKEADERRFEEGILSADERENAYAGCRLPAGLASRWPR